MPLGSMAADHPVLMNKNISFTVPQCIKVRTYYLRYYTTWPNIITLPTTFLIPQLGINISIQTITWLTCHQVSMGKLSSISTAAGPTWADGQTPTATARPIWAPSLDIQFQFGYWFLDYYQMGVTFQQMVHSLSEENTRSDLSTVLVGSLNAFNAATMLPIAWEETYQESVGVTIFPYLSSFPQHPLSFLLFSHYDSYSFSFSHNVIIAPP